MENFLIRAHVIKFLGFFNYSESFIYISITDLANTVIEKAFCIYLLKINIYIYVYRMLQCFTSYHWIIAYNNVQYLRSWNYQKFRILSCSICLNVTKLHTRIVNMSQLTDRQPIPITQNRAYTFGFFGQQDRWGAQ